MEKSVSAHGKRRKPREVRAGWARYRRLHDAGSPVRWDEELPGIRRFFTDDPWGNRLEFLARTD
jgi:hypothetical protein